MPPKHVPCRGYHRLMADRARVQTDKKKRAATRAQRSRYSRTRRIPWVAIGAAIAAVIAVFLIGRSLGVGEKAVGTYIPAAGVGQHIPDGQPITYPQVPPVGGPHWGTPALWGVSSQAIPDERVVHNLEHGGVVISQNGMSAEDLARLQTFLSSYPKDQYNEVKVVVRPYDRIPRGTTVLTAWSWTETLNGYDEGKVREFLDAHLNKCCESVP